MTEGLTELLSIEEIERCTIAVVFFFTACGLFFSPFMAWSVFIGGVLVSGNFWLGSRGAKVMMRQISGHIVRNSCVEDGRAEVAGGCVSEDSAENSTESDTQLQELIRRKRTLYVLHFILRIASTGIVLFLLIRWQLVNIFGLIMGLSTIVAVVAALALLALYRCGILQNQRRS